MPSAAPATSPPLSIPRAFHVRSPIHPVNSRIGQGVRWRLPSGTSAPWLQAGRIHAPKSQANHLRKTLRVASNNGSPTGPLARWTIAGWRLPPLEADALLNRHTAESALPNLTADHFTGTMPAVHVVHSASPDPQPTLHCPTHEAYACISSSKVAGGRIPWSIVKPCRICFSVNAGHAISSTSDGRRCSFLRAKCQRIQ